MESGTSELLRDESVRKHYLELVQWAASGPVSQQCWKSAAQPHLAALLPHSALIGVVGRRSFEHIEVAGVISVDHPLEHLATLQRTFRIADRPILAQWLDTQSPILIDIRHTPAASVLEQREAARYGLGRLAIHGHLDLLGHTGTYFSFSGICESVTSAYAQAVLSLIVPHLHVALCRFAKVECVESTELTPHEFALWRWIAAGRRSADIATVTGRSEKTIRNQLTVLYRKLGVASRSEAAREFMLRGR